MSNDEKNKSIVILDACRQDYDNRSMIMPDIEDPVNLKLGFSTSFGYKNWKLLSILELDFQAGGLFYSSTLSKHVLTPYYSGQLEVQLFMHHGNKVDNATHHKQSPAVYVGQELEELILHS